jgi:hypothetical protein
VSYVEGIMRGVVLGVERRRRWSDEDKPSIVSSVGIDGATFARGIFFARFAPSPGEHDLP